MSKQVLVIYHGSCADGFGAAWAARKFFGDTAEYYPGVYQTPPPDVTGRDVVLVDFSYKRPVLEQMAHAAKSLLVLDHHKSAEEDLRTGYGAGSDPSVYIQRYDEWRGVHSWERHKSNVAIGQNEGALEIFALFDMERSGAGITWDFFHPDKPRPPLINHIEDRDLWRFKLPGTREIQAALFSYPYDFGLWDDLMAEDTRILLHAGEAIERKHHKDIAELVAKCKRRMTIAGVDVPVASLPYTLSSDAGHLMAQGEPFAACYYDVHDARCFSLRSTDEGQDVSAIAKAFGGGGHRNAAGFAVPRDHELARA